MRFLFLLSTSLLLSLPTSVSRSGAFAELSGAAAALSIQVPAVQAPAAVPDEDPLLPVRNAVAPLFKVLSGQYLSDAEIQGLESQFTQEGFASLMKVWSEGMPQPGTSPKDDRERFAALTRWIADEIRSTGDKPDPWTVAPDWEGVSNGRSVGFHLGLAPDSHGYYLARALSSEGQARPDDLLVLTNDPFGDDEAYLFVLARENGVLRIKLVELLR